MTYPTNDERRKVAARLQRIIGKCKYDYSLCVLYDESIGGNCEAVERNVEECDNECFDSLLARLAELIEPEPERTCHIVMVSPGEWECDACGGGIDCDSYDEDDPPNYNYCPNCGAKVVESE